MQTISKKTAKILNFEIPYKIILILLILILCVLIFPLLYIAKWNVPSADDYSNGVYVHDAIVQGAGFIDIIKIAAERAINIYKSWQGTLSANFLFALQPASFGNQYYAVVPFLMLFSLIISVIIFILSFFSLFTPNKQYGTIIAIIILIGMTQFLPSPVEGFYWYTGSIFYNFFFSISLVFYALLLKIAAGSSKNKPIGKIIIVSLLGLLIAFGNYITALTTIIILITLLFLSIFTKQKKFFSYMIFPTFLYCVAFYLNVTAPGNSARQSLSHEDISLMKTIITSFQYGVTKITEWNRLPIIALYLFLVPLLWKIADKSNFTFKDPWLVSLYSFCLFSSMYSPTVYTGSEAAVGRIENIRFFAILILFVINIFYWIGWLGKYILRYKGKHNFQISVSYLIGIITLFLIGTINIPSYRITSYSAVQSYYLGQIGMYKHVFNQRMEILENPEITDAVLREYPRKKPFVLYFDDITQDINDWRNIDTSRYFHKNTVRLRTNEEIEAIQNQ